MRSSGRCGVTVRFGVATVAVAMMVLAAGAASAAPGGDDPTAAESDSTATGVPDDQDSTVPVLDSLTVEAPASEQQTTSTSAIVPPAPIADAPQLTISVDNGKTSVTTGDALDYTVTIQNMGTADIAGLRVTQTMPPGLQFAAADSGGSAQDGEVIWTVDLAKGAKSTFRTSARVTATPAELLRLATVACASTTADAAPIVCAAHSDQLPAGAAAQADQAAMAAAAPAAAGRPWWYLPAGIGAAVLLALVVLATVLVRRRRQPEQAP